MWQNKNLTTIQKRCVLDARGGNKISDVNGNVRSIWPTGISWSFDPLRGLLPAGGTAFLLQCVSGVALALGLAVGAAGLSLNLSSVSLLYLLMVVAYAVRFGFWQASVVSVAALICQTYVFVAPLYSFHIADSRNVIAIIVFEGSALLVSRVSWREKTYALQKENKRRTMESLYCVSRGALLLKMGEQAEQKMAELIQREFAVSAVAVVNASSGSVGTSGITQVEALAILEQPTTAGREMELAAIASQRPLQNAEGRTGSLLVMGDIQELAMDSLASLVSLTLDRHQAFVKEGLSDAARQTEQLRTTVLDGLAHAFKTPLTIIRAASSGLLEIGELNDLQDELAKMIDEQSTRLDDLASELLRTARVGPEQLCLSVQTLSVAPLVDEVVQQVRREQAEVSPEGCVPIITVTPIPQSLRITADCRMIASTLKELLVNAAKYSTPGSKIDVSTMETESEMVIAVRSHGAIIKPEERERIFERFYRGENHSDSAPGTGIGLSVARGVAEAHGGQIWVVSNEVDGTIFHMSLPKDGMKRRA